MNRTQQSLTSKLMHAKQEEVRIRAALLTMRQDEPWQVARLAEELCEDNKFNMIIVG